MEKLMFEFRKWLFRKRKDLSSIILYIVFVICLIILAVGYNTQFKRLKLTYMEQMDTIHLYNSNIAALPELSLSSEIMNKKVNDIKNVYSRLNSIVPDERNVPFVTSQISLAAANNNVDIESMSKVLETNVTLGKDTFGVVKYSLTSFSTYEDIVNLLATLETSNSIFAIEKISIGPLSEDEFEEYKDASLVKTSLDINIYMKSKS